MSGINKRLLTCWVTGNYAKKCKLSKAQYNAINDRFKIITSYCPREFSRYPESLQYLANYKATQHRQMLLHYGGSAIHGIVKQEVYIHYTVLSAAIRCITLPNPSAVHLKLAEIALEKFILDAPLVYNLNISSLNIHDLCHLVDDVKRFGNIDSYSAWAYKNNMTFCRKLVAKPAFTFQQIHNR